MAEKYMIPPDAFIRMFPKANPAMVNYINYCFPKYGIVTLNQVSFFLTISAKETGGETRFDENLNYRASTLLKMWPGRYDAALAAAHHFKPQLIANHVYGNMSGTGNKPGTNDGWTFRGRGMLQVTHRDAYQKFADYKGLASAEEAVRYLETPQGVVEGSCWFWCFYKKINSKYCDNEGQFVTAFEHVGANGWEKAMEWYPKIRGILAKTLWTGTGPAVDPNPENRKAQVVKAVSKTPATIPYRIDAVIPTTDTTKAPATASSTASGGSSKIPDYLLAGGGPKPAPTASGGFQLSYGGITPKKEEPFRVINIDTTVTDIVVPEKRSVYKGPRKRIAKNFYRDQFECRCGCGFNTVDAFLIIVMQTLSNSLKRYIHIVSGDRCEEYNKKHKGVRGSMHTLGKAVDIVVPTDPITNEPPLNSAQIISKIKGIFGNSVYCYAMSDSMVHLDVRSPLKSSGRRVKLGKSFHRDQFECKDGTGDMIDIMIIMTLEKLIELFKRPMTVTSAYRSPAHNAKIGGKKNSQHKLGKATDFQFQDFEGKATIPSSYMVKFLKETFGTQIYTYSINARTTHVDVRGM